MQRVGSAAQALVKTPARRLALDGGRSWAPLGLGGRFSGAAGRASYLDALVVRRTQTAIVSILGFAARFSEFGQTVELAVGSPLWGLGAADREIKKWPDELHGCMVIVLFSSCS